MERTGSATGRVPPSASPGPGCGRRSTRRGAGPARDVRTGASFADAAAEYLRYIGEDRARKASTVEDYRSIIRVHLLPAFGEMPLEDVTVSAVEAFQAVLGQREHRGRRITPRTRNKVLNVLHGAFARAKKVWGPRS